MTRTSFFVVFVGDCHGFDVCSSYAKLWGGINVAPEKIFTASRSI